jgi:hypothetical protein
VKAAITAGQPGWVRWSQSTRPATITSDATRLATIVARSSESISWRTGRTAKPATKNTSR